MADYLEKLKKLSENKINLLAYSEIDEKKWKNGDISMLMSSEAPGFIKSIIKHKKRKDSSRHLQMWYFGEAYVASKFASSVKEGWFCSFKWLHDQTWINGKNPDREKDKVIAGLKRQFYNEALMKYIGENKLLDLQNKGREDKEGNTHKPKAPDIWFVDKKGRSHFIEIKKADVRDEPSDEQLIGLAIIEKYLKYSVHIVLLYRADKNVPDDYKFAKHIKRFEKFKTIV